jgi:hypothetical protein
MKKIEVWWIARWSNVCLLLASNFLSFPFLSFPMSLSVFSAAQMRAANESATIFEKGDIRYILLTADTQCGKTGAYNATINVMLKSRLVDRVYVLCGSSDTHLRDQAKRDAFEKYNPFMKDSIHVIFRQDFDKYKMDISNSLIIVDESHLDQNITQKLAVFLAKHGLAMDGTRQIMHDKNVFILSVDATPYSEIASISHNLSRGKALVRLEGEKHTDPSKKSYFGPIDFYTNRLISSVFNYDREPEQFKALLTKHSGMYNIIRITGGKKDHRNSRIERIMEICEECDCEVLMYNSAKRDVNLYCKDCANGIECKNLNKKNLYHKPERTCVVIIDNLLRAGDVIPKTHIGFAWEGSKSSKTDAVIQGLVGRMCGYYYTTDRKPELFVPQSLLEKNETKLISMCEIERHHAAHTTFGADCIIPTRATNLYGHTNPKRSDTTTTEEEKFICPPIRFNLAEDIEYLTPDSCNLTIKQRCLSALRLNMQLIEQHPTLTAQQKEEILNSLSESNAEQLNIRKLEHNKNSSQDNYLKDLVKAQKDNCITTQHISDYPFCTFFTVFPDYEDAPRGVRGGDVFTVFYTRAAGELMSSSLTSRVSKVRKCCGFLKRELTVASDSDADTSVGFTKDMLSTPDKFENSLRKYMQYIVQMLTDGFVSGDCISFKEDRNFSKSDFHFKTTKNNDIHKICRKLAKEFKYEITDKYTRAKSDCFALDTISWKKIE